MALQIGDAAATAGMSQAIYDEIDHQLSAGLSADDLTKIRPSWQKLAFAIATGVINHLAANAEIFGIQTSGAVTVTVKDNSGTTTIGTGTGTVNSSQTGATTGHVR